jgi:uncharacterized protein YutE (UPF0331/DUF86 family)
MRRGESNSDDAEAAPKIPLPIAQRLSAIVPAYQTLQLILSEVSFEDYKDGLHSRDPVKLKDVVFPLERAFEVANNFVAELAALGLEELGRASMDGPGDLDALAAEGVIPARLAEQLADIHRTRNDVTHDYPDLRASVIYPACEELAKVLPAFLRAYVRWLRDLGYAAPSV